MDSGTGGARSAIWAAPRPSTLKGAHRAQRSEGQTARVKIWDQARVSPATLERHRRSYRQTPQHQAGRLAARPPLAAIPPLKAPERSSTCPTRLRFPTRTMSGFGSPDRCCRKAHNRVKLLLFLNVGGFDGATIELRVCGELFVSAPSGRVPSTSNTFLVFHNSPFYRTRLWEGISRPGPRSSRSTS